MRILVIDDEPTSTDLLKDYLKIDSSTNEIVVCSDAESGIVAHLTTPFPLIILDLVLPGMNGIELCKKIRVLPKNKQCYIIAATGEDTSVFLNKILEAGANDYISKPFALDTFLLRLKIAKYRIATAEKPHPTDNRQDSAVMLLNASPDIIVLLDTQGTILDCNDAFTQVTKKTYSELIGASSWNSLPPDVAERRKEKFKEVIYTRQPKRYEDQREGQWKEYLICPILDSHQEVHRLAVFIRNTTEFKQAENALFEAKNNAELSNQSKSEFFVNMCHGINTPLNAIVGFGHLLLKQSDKLKLPGQFTRYLQPIIDSSYRLSEIMTNILDLVQMESEKTTVNEEDLNLKLLLQGVFQIQKAKAQQKGLVYTFDYDANLPHKIRSDRSLLNQIFLFLIEKAIMYTPKGNSVHLNVKKDKDTMIFEIANVGIGISEEQQRNIFDIFDRADKSSAYQYGGFGVGMPIIKNMVDLLRGSIKIESIPGKGSTFLVKIPLIESQPVDKEKGLLSSGIRFCKDNVIMVAEDNPTNQEIMKLLFYDLKLPVYIVKNGEEAVEKTLELYKSNQTLDLILMDMYMPVMGGMDATKQIHAIPGCEEIPIIALSADTSMERQKAASKSGFSGYITKPIDFDKMLSILVKYLRQDKPGVIPSEGKTPTKSVPEEIEQKLIEGFKMLSSISIFQTEKLIDQINALRSLEEGFDSQYHNLLDQLETTAINADKDELKRLLDRVI